MKRSKIFLAATASLLAVVGFISAKAHSYTAGLTYFTSASRHNGCTVKVTGAGTTTDNLSTTIVGHTKYSETVCSGKPVYAE